MLGFQCSEMRLPQNSLLSEFIKELPQTKSTSPNPEESNRPFCFLISGSWHLSCLEPTACLNLPGCISPHPKLDHRYGFPSTPGSQGAPEEACPPQQCCLRLPRMSKCTASDKSPPYWFNGRQMSGDLRAQGNFNHSRGCLFQIQRQLGSPGMLPHG